MTRNTSTFVQETRERESWLASVLDREGADLDDLRPLLATAALVRGVAQNIPVPEEAEERSRREAVEFMEARMAEDRSSSEPRAPWYLRLGSGMRVVFTFRRRR